MPVITNAEYLQVDTAGIFDHPFIFTAMFFDIFFFYFTIRDMDIDRIDINMIEKIGAHETVVTLQRIIIDRVIFIEVETDNIFETQVFFCMQPDEFGIQ